MPRYLGVDYWRKRIEQRREFYTRALMIVPQNLSTVGVASEHNVCNAQWASCKNLGKFEDPITADCCNLNWRLGSDCFEFWKHKLNSPERCHWTSGCQAFCRGIGEVIPSSNPDSDDSFDFDDILTPNDQTGTAVEQFKKEDLKHIEVKECLEDIVTFDGLKEIHKNMPKLSCLISRLQPRPVKDPLADDGGTQYTETMCFKDQLTLYEKEAVDDQPEESHFDMFQVIPNVVHEDEGAMEEVLIPASRGNGEDPVQSLLDIDAKIMKFLEQETEDEVETQDSINIVQGTKLEMDVDKTNMVASTSLGANFLTINKYEESQDKQLIKSTLLESPVLLPSDTLLPLHLPSIHQLSKALQLISVDLNSPMLFLRQFEKEILLVRVWQQEKFFDEILSLRLQEPEMPPPSPFPCVSVLRVREQLALVEESGLGGLELQLAWDPWVSSKDHMQWAAQPEPFTPVGVCLTLSGIMDGEHFSKFSKDQMNATEAEQENLELTEKNQAIEKHFEKTDGGRERKPGRQARVVADGRLTDFSPLDGFMMLRSSVTKAQDQLQDTSVDNIVEPQKTDLDPAKAARIENLEVHFTDHHQEVLLALHVFGNPYLDLLVKAGEVPASASLSNTKVDTALFLVKQREKQSKTSKVAEESSEVYKSLVVLYAVVGAADLLVHCCLESAISHLAAVQEKFHKTLGACLDDIRKQLFQFKVAFDQDNVLHPKIATLCRTVQDVVSKVSADSAQRVLVVLKRNLSCLAYCIEKALNLTGNISTKVIRLLNEETSDLIESHKCIIMSEDAVDDKLEMSAFSLAIQYESGPSAFAKRCQLTKVNFLSLYCSYPNKAGHKRKQTLMEVLNPEMNVTVICAQTVTKQKHLLQLIESRYNIAIIERGQDEESQVPIADIIIDERHCIVLHDVFNITEDYQVEHLTRKLSSLGLQYTHCWLVFHCSSSPAKRCYILSNKVIENLSKVEAALANLNKNQDHFHISYKVLIAYSVEHLAAVVRYCCDVVVETSTVWSGEDWTRDWISAEPSQEELFLASIPCITSFSAQFMLSNCCLGSILSYSLPELVEHFPQLPEKVLLMFYKMINCDTGLHLRSSESNTTNQEVYLATSDLEMNTFNDDGAKPQIHYQEPNWNRKDPCESVCFDADLSGQGQGTLRLERNHSAKIPPTIFGPQSFHPMSQLENVNSFSHDSEDSRLREISQCNKPNQYLLAELEGMARKERQLEEFTDFPNFNIMGTSLQNGIGENKFLNSKFSDCTDVSDLNLHMPQVSNASMSSAYNLVTNNAPSFQNSTGNRQSHGYLLHETAKTRNLILEEFKQNNSNGSSIQNSNKNFSGKSNSDLNVLERVNHAPCKMSRNAYAPVKAEPLSRSKQCKPVLSEHFQNMLPRPTPHWPVLSEHFCRRLLRPSEHRVSIGLAQPLRRSIPSQDFHKESQVVPNVSRWWGEDSPPMDLDGSPEIGYNHNLMDTASVQVHEDSFTHKHGMSPESPYLGGYQYDTPDKRKKLSYQPLPGHSAGQTVLTFK